MLNINNDKNFRYIKSFDALRGIAVISVLLLHGTYSYFKGGWIGVDLFFILSGYLITTLLVNEYLKTGKISFLKFYARRALRLLPPLIICVLIANILWSITPKAEYPLANRTQATVGALFYFTNFQNSLNFNMGHLWSLSVEEHFYFAWPILLMHVFLKLNNDKRIVYLSIIIGVITIIRILCFYYNFHWGGFIIDSYRCTFCRIDSILMGAILSFIALSDKVEKIKKNKYVIMLFLLVFIVIVFTIDLHNKYWNSGGFVLTNLFCFLIVWFAIDNQEYQILNNKILSWIGKRSYGIYVYHFPIFMAIEVFRQPHNILNYVGVFLFKMAASILFSSVIYKYVEKPILNYKKHYSVKTDLVMLGK